MNSTWKKVKSTHLHCGAQEQKLSTKATGEVVPEQFSLRLRKEKYISLLLLPRKPPPLSLHKLILTRETSILLVGYDNKLAGKKTKKISVFTVSFLVFLSPDWSKVLQMVSKRLTKLRFWQKLSF